VELITPHRTINYHETRKGGQDPVWAVAPLIIIIIINAPVSHSEHTWFEYQQGSDTLYEAYRYFSHPTWKMHKQRFKYLYIQSHRQLI
jgi:hypothetical protein